MKKDKVADNTKKRPLGQIAGNIHRIFLVIINKNLAHLDIERFYYPVLLIEAGEGNLTQQEIAEKLFCDKVQVVRIIDYLSEHGYVNRVQNASDRRKYGLEITDKAKKVIPDIKKAWEKANAILLSNLSDNQIKELYATLKIIENNLSSYESHASE
jgi:MarR family transcriptional regulator, transcriptional regulator for hemolysin